MATFKEFICRAVASECSLRITSAIGRAIIPKISITKPLYLLLVLSLSCIYGLVAQDSTLKKRLSFKIWITGTDSSTAAGWLSTISDSSLELSKKPKRFNNLQVIANNRLQQFDYSRLNLIMLKRNNGAGRGAAIGAVCGTLIGVIAGFSAGDDQPANKDGIGLGNLFKMTAADKAILGGFGGAAIGAGLGALTGALVRQSFSIEGIREKFGEMRLYIIRHAYRK